MISNQSMFKEAFKNSGLLGKLLQLVLASFFFTLVAIVIWKVIWGDYTNVNSLKALQLLNSVFLFIVTPLVLGYMWYNSPKDAYRLNSKPSGRMVLMVVFLMLMAVPFINLLAYLNEQVVLPRGLSFIENYLRDQEDAAAKLVEQFLAVHSIGGVLFNLILIAVIPAFGEELFFRGTLQKIFSERKSQITAIWVTAIIFSLIHGQFYGFVPRMLLGALFGYLLVWSKSLWLPIIAHFTNNAMAVLVASFGKNNAEIQSIENIGKAETFWFGIISAIISGWIIWKIYRFSHRKTDELPPVG